MYVQRVEQVLRDLRSPSREDLRQALLRLHTTREDLAPFLQVTKEKPYYRKLLYKTDEVELLVMNWSDLACAPHDHGSSYGWVQIVDGNSLHTIYKAEENLLPVPLFTEIQRKGRMFFAPVRGIHQMQDDGDGRLLTLHLYAPPITGMKVYDLEACAACVVSDDCGAWWPEEQRQKVRDIQLRRK
ncbi:cysteine dioxygenase [Ectobacillus ponti]|uniref:Cysteine dioxygenase family protein n=1 Tax=Ectobacillus ponti TaxID=2961894 RepID=A0AA42BNX0_9BACI|nr:cysteine dioxygenase family protein [Ectobacillus ponti]MCP8967796.1 cysteine dioxygenase family protein [Ectobacillus ponti]